MDPLTILATIKAAQTTIKTAISIGKDVGAIAKDLSDLMHGVAKITQAAAQPKGWKTKGSAEARAIEAYTAKMEAMDIEAKVKGMIIGEYGLNAWDDLQRQVIISRKQMKAEAEQKAKEQEAMLEVMLLIALVLILISVFGFVIYAAFKFRQAYI